MRLKLHHWLNLAILALTAAWACLGFYFLSTAEPRPRAVEAVERIDGSTTPDSEIFPAGKTAVATEEGTASWYGPPYHGRKTASGEIYDMYGLSAAHRTLPMGSRILVTNLRNRHSLTLRVNDRGPFIAGRVLDVSLGAARRLDFERQGLAPVRIEVLP